MNDLKKQVVEIINNLNQDWVKCIEEGEKKGGIDLGEMFGKFSDHVQKIDVAFLNAGERVYPQPQGQKKGKLGGFFS